MLQRINHAQVRLDSTEVTFRGQHEKVFSVLSGGRPIPAFASDDSGRTGERQVMLALWQL
jgi:hypothetical protein